MKKTIIAMTAASALMAGTVMAPTAANAFAFWIIPAIVAAGIGGAAVGGAANSQAEADARAQAYADADDTYGYQPGYRARDEVVTRSEVAPRRCRVTRERMPDGGWQRVQICR